MWGMIFITSPAEIGLVAGFIIIISSSYTNTKVVKLFARFSAGDARIPLKYHVTSVSNQLVPLVLASSDNYLVH